MEEQVTIQSDVTLKGTMTFPDTEEATFPGILILAGSGKLNRDGNAKRGKFQLHLYKQLADILTSFGFATMRYDKRGIGESEGDFLTTGLWDAVIDAENALDVLASHPRVDSNRIIVLGHSEGSIVGTTLNERMPVKGLILLSGGGGGIRENLDLQREQLYKEMRTAKGLKGFIFKLFKTIEKSEKQAQATYRKMASTNKDVIRVAGFIKMPAKYFREHFHYDVVEGLKKIACPVLAINGLKDFQASPDFLKRIPENVQGESTCLLIENMDHGLKEQLTPISLLTAKKDIVKSIGKPIHGELVDKLESWLNEWKKDTALGK